MTTNALRPSPAFSPKPPTLLGGPRFSVVPDSKRFLGFRWIFPPFVFLFFLPSPPFFLRASTPRLFLPPNLGPSSGPADRPSTALGLFPPGLWSSPLPNEAGRFPQPLKSSFTPLLALLARSANLFPPSVGSPLHVASFPWTDRATEENFVPVPSGRRGLIICSLVYRSAANDHILVKEYPQFSSSLVGFPSGTTVLERMLPLPPLFQA